MEFDKEAVERRFVVSVLSALCNNLLEQKHVPVFLREDDSAITYQALENVGFRSTGNRLIMVDGIKQATDKS